MGCSRAPTKDFIQICKSSQKKKNLVKASILFYYHLSPNLIALKTIQYRPPRAFRWFPSCPIHPPSLPRVFGWLLCLFIDWGPPKTTTKFVILFFSPKFDSRNDATASTPIINVLRSLSQGYIPSIVPTLGWLLCPPIHWKPSKT